MLKATVVNLTALESVSKSYTHTTTTTCRREGKKKEVNAGVHPRAPTQCPQLTEARVLCEVTQEPLTLLLCIATATTAAPGGYHDARRAGVHVVRSHVKTWPGEGKNGKAVGPCLWTPDSLVHTHTHASQRTILIEHCYPNN